MCFIFFFNPAVINFISSWQIAVKHLTEEFGPTAIALGFIYLLIRYTLFHSYSYVFFETWKRLTQTICKTILVLLLHHLSGAPYWPFIVLQCWEGACLYKLVQQHAHVLPGDGAALQRRLQPVSYKHEQQLSAVHLLHTLQGLLLGHRRTYRLFRLLKDSNITVHVICMHKGFIVNSECS